ncbi:MAG: hypothetical protein AAGA85_20655, partial [Bacteroidota bacterium]
MIFLLVLLNKKRIIADYILLVIIVLFLLYLVSNIYFSYTPGLLGFLALLTTAALLFFPFVVYALFLMERGHEFKKWWLWFGLFDGLFLLFIYSDIFLFNRLATHSIEDLLVTPPTTYWVFYKAHGIYKIAVLVWLLAKTRKFDAQLDDYYSNKEHVSIKWLRNFIWIYLGENAISTIAFIPFDLGYFEYIEIPYLISNLVLVFSWFYLVYFGIKQYDLANFRAATQENAREERKYLSSSLTDEAVDSLYGSIVRLFEEDKMFHNPALRVQDL